MLIKITKLLFQLIRAALIIYIIIEVDRLFFDDKPVILLSWFVWIFRYYGKYSNVESRSRRTAKYLLSLIHMMLIMYIIFTVDRIVFGGLPAVLIFWLITTIGYHIHLTRKRRRTNNAETLTPTHVTGLPDIHVGKDFRPRKNP